MKYVNKTTVISTVVGLAVFGGLLFGLKKYGGATGASVAGTISQ